MIFKNTDNRFGIITITLHWVMAILIIGLLILGIYMVELPVSLAKLRYYGWHKEYGLLVLGLAIFRLFWRFYNINPRLDLSFLEKLAARSVHWAFYFFMFAMPITGWVITSAAGLPASFFGLYTLPNIVSPNEETRLLFQEIHQWLGYALILTITMHASAALKHHFINKDNILKRMLP